MPPRRLARRAGYRPARRTYRKPTTRRPRSKTSLRGVLVIGAILVSISNPVAGIPLLVAVLGGIWLLTPTRRGPRRLVRPTRRIVSASADYLAMSPKQFEHALADLCRRDGCTSVQVVGGAGDLGADVICTTPAGQRLVIQAKRFGPRSTVGSGDVQKVNGTYRDIHRAQLAAIVTTNRFTKDALELAHRLRIRPYDGTKLAAWASRTGPAPWQ